MIQDRFHPSGHPTFGCLPRKSHPGKWCAMAADKIPLVPEADWDALAAQITLRPYVKAVLDQDGVGSCACEAVAAAVMIGRALAGLPHVLLNPLFIYHTTSGGVDQGSSIDENLAFVRENGIAPESVWPRSMGWRAKPSAEAVEAAKAFRIYEFYDIATIAEMVSGEVKAFPVVHGAQGHAICAVAHKGTYPLIVNSWGSDWEDGGFGRWTDYRNINWSYGSFAVRTVE